MLFALTSLFQALPSFDPFVETLLLASLPAFAFLPTVYLLQEKGLPLVEICELLHWRAQSSVKSRLQSNPSRPNATAIAPRASTTNDSEKPGGTLDGRKASYTTIVMYHYIILGCEYFRMYERVGCATDVDCESSWLSLRQSLVVTQIVWSNRRSR